MPSVNCHWLQKQFILLCAVFSVLLCCDLVAQSSEGEACHGRLLLEVDEGSVLTVVGQNGDPDLQLLCVQLHRAELHHNGAFIVSCLFLFS